MPTASPFRTDSWIPAPRLAAFLAVLLASCGAIKPARMELPSGFGQAAEFREVQGIGGTARGHFQLDAIEGVFSRSATRLQVFDIYDGRGARVAFSYDGVDADCRARERQLNFGALNFSPKPMAYGCNFERNGTPLVAHFEVQETKDGLAGALSQKARRGEFLVDEQRIAIRSVHRIQGSPIAMAMPIGYVFEIDGQAIAAVELNGGVRIYAAENQPLRVRSAITLASLALGLLWDPGDNDS